MNRRSILAGSTALALAAVPTVAIAEEPHSRVRRLMDELSDALNDVHQGSFRALVEPSASSARCPILLEQRLGEGYEMERAIENFKRVAMRYDPAVRGVVVVRDSKGHLAAVMPDRVDAGPYHPTSTP